MNAHARLVACLSILLAIVGGGCLLPAEPPPSSLPGGSPSSAATASAGPSVAQKHVAYGVVYPYPNAWTEEDRPAIRARLAYLRELGVGVVVQVFSSAPVDTGREQDWLIFLDEAQAQDIQVIARLWPPRDWDGTQFDFTYVGRFLAQVRDHPALLAYFALHEPLETFTGGQLRAYYQAVKGYAPNVLVFNAMSDIAGFEADPRFADRRFTAGICDLCAIWYYPFYTQNGLPISDWARVTERVAANVALVQSRDPDAQVWFLGQSYALAANSPPLRMPAAEEMESLAGLLLQDPEIDGLLWYPWGHSSYDQVLGDPASASQQQALRTIYERYMEGDR